MTTIEYDLTDLSDFSELEKLIKFYEAVIFYGIGGYHGKRHFTAISKYSPVVITFSSHSLSEERRLILDDTLRQFISFGINNINKISDKVHVENLGEIISGIEDIMYKAIFSMIKCPKCGHVSLQDENRTFCPFCGEQLIENNPNYEKDEDGTAPLKVCRDCEIAPSAYLQILNNCPLCGNTLTSLKNTFWYDYQGFDYEDYFRGVLLNEIILDEEDE